MVFCISCNMCYISCTDVDAYEHTLCTKKHAYKLMNIIISI